MIDWLAIRNEYINTSISQRKLADKYMVSFNTLKDKANRECWNDEKKKAHNKIAIRTQQKTADILVNNEVNRISRINSAADKLLTALEQATSELDKHIVRNKKKSKTIEYNYDVGKPAREVIDEIESIDSVVSTIDKQGLKTLASALKDLRDVTGVGEDNNTEEAFDSLISAIKDKDNADN